MTIVETTSTLNISRPLEISNDGAFSSDPDISALVRQNLKNLLLTRVGERVHRRNFGCKLLNLLFEQKTTALKTAISEEIIRATSIWLNYITILQIFVLYYGDKVPSGINVVELPQENETLIIISFKFQASSQTISDILQLKVEVAEPI